MTTVWPMWRSGAVGSKPSLTRSGVRVASERQSFRCSSSSTNRSTHLALRMASWRCASCSMAVPVMPRILSTTGALSTTGGSSPQPKRPCRSPVGRRAARPLALGTRPTVCYISRHGDSGACTANIRPPTGVVAPGHRHDFLVPHRDDRHRVRRRSRHLRRIPGGSAEPGRPRGIPAQHRHHALHRSGRALPLVLRAAAHTGPARPDPRPPEAGGAGRRGFPLLRAPRPVGAGHRPGPGHEPAGPAQGAGRQHDHAAARPRPLPHPREEHLPEDQGGPPRRRDRKAVTPRRRSWSSTSIWSTSATGPTGWRPPRRPTSRSRWAI